MARPYRDRVELFVTPVDLAEFSLAEAGSVVVDGLRLPGADSPVPLTLIPGYEYRIHEVSDGLWALERRRS